MRKALLVLLGLILSVSAHSATADESAGVTPFYRNGIYGTLLGDPGVNFFGIDYAYRFNPELRLNAGVGTIFFGSTYGLGLNYYFSEPSDFRPFIGTGLNVLSVADFHESAIFGRVNTTFLYQNFKVGVEYAATSGFFIDLHLAGLVFYSGGSDRTFYFNPIPALGIGSYF